MDALRKCIDGFLEFGDFRDCRPAKKNPCAPLLDAYVKYEDKITQQGGSGRP